MKHQKRILALVLALLLLLSLAGCSLSNNEAARSSETVSYEGAPISVALSASAADFSLLKLLDSEIYSVSQQDAVAAALKTDLALVPLWRAQQMLQNGEADIQIVALNTFGTYSVLTNGAEVAGVKDLSGQTVFVGQAYAPSELSLSHTGEQAKNVLQAVLDKFGVTAAMENDSAETVYEKLLSGEVKVALLPEPYASLAAAKGDAAIAFTLTDAWAQSGAGEPLVENCIVAKTSFIKSNPSGLKKFLSDLRASVEWVNLNPQDAVNLLIEKSFVDASLLQVDESQSDRKQTAALQQRAVDLISRSNAVLLEGDAMIRAAAQSPAVLAAIPAEAFYTAD